MNMSNNEMRELSGAELDEVAGGAGVVDTIIDTAVALWHTITNTPPGGHGSGTGGGTGGGGGNGTGQGNGKGRPA